MQAAVEANVAYQARNDPEYQQLVAQQQEMRGPGALSAMQVGQASLSRPLCLHAVLGGRLLLGPFLCKACSALP